MLAYGERSYIGSKSFVFGVIPTVELFSARQESLLQGLMREIVRMTSQKQPLEMGIPLYPFSHASLWAGKAQTTEGLEEDPTSGIPLPSSPPLEEAALTPGTLTLAMVCIVLFSAHVRRKGRREMACRFTSHREKRVWHHREEM
jgi:hypothetical protein